jgi:bacillithiol system protein YtxJ
MQWIDLSDIAQVDELKTQEGYSVIFKHSTRCSISLMARKSFEADWDILPETTKLYFLDLIAHREVSNYIAELFQVHHESPQMLLIKNGECVLDASHGEISVAEIIEVIKS